MIGPSWPTSSEILPPRLISQGIPHAQCSSHSAQNQMAQKSLSDWLRLPDIGSRSGLGGHRSQQGSISRTTLAGLHLAAKVRVTESRQRVLILSREASIRLLFLVPRLLETPPRPADPGTILPWGSYWHGFALLLVGLARVSRRTADEG